ncbi:MAG: alpha/beta fold hydrolase [Actinobacteria bacterium]|nr:alpha/beta fold hydrolase [Actinomycetota bacterium]
MVASALRAADGVVLDAALHLPVGAHPRGAVVQAHGINADMDEGGMFRRLADSLTDEGFGVLRFSFRGHGRSDGAQQGATIAGEILDLQAAVDAAREGFRAPLSVVAASFGAVATCLSLPYLQGVLRSLVLWNPVLDLHRTLVEPSLPWAVENFGAVQQALLASQGFFSVESTFEVGRVMFEEMRHYRPIDDFVRSQVPALVVHGNRDSAVPYGIARDAADARGSCDFYTVRGSDHGFDSREHEDEAITATITWLTERYKD